MDSDEVLESKVALLASMLKRAHHAVVYSGAGLSRASGIADYASGPGSLAGLGAPRLRSPLEAEPTLSHRVIAQLQKRALIKEVVNQNHDGLAQKAGVPERAVNEIHGAWFDPSNPVVQFNQNLRSDLFERLLKTEETTDLSVVVGTSLSGMNADRVAETCAMKFSEQQIGLGAVIINLQRTRLDAQASLRIWAPADSVFALLAEFLRLPTTALRRGPPLLTALVPYSATGRPAIAGRLMLLDLRIGESVISGQEGDGGLRHREGLVESVDTLGQALITLKAPGKLSRSCVLGHWWLREARDNLVSSLPIRNQNARIFEPEESMCTVVHTARAVGDRFEWSLAIQDSVLPIESVRFELHSTFTPSCVLLDAAPFVLIRTGWGEFDIPLRIVFCDESFVEIVHSLDLSCAHGRQSVQMNQRRLPKE